MDAFEQVVATILGREGYWVRTSVKVGLSTEEKREIGRPSSPRWELDVVAYSGARNELLVVECKSYLDSYGVRASSFGDSREDETRYKLFTDDVLRRVVLSRLAIELEEQGFCPLGLTPILCLAAGNIYGDPAPLREVFALNGWRLFESGWLLAGLQKLADESYDNSIASVVAKLVLRPPRSVREPKVAARESSDRDRVEPERRARALIVALYLSRFGHAALGLGNQDHTFERAAELLDVKKHTLKNYRDFFDPHTESGRRGWWQVELPEEHREVLRRYESASEAELRAVAKDALRLS